jgi:hypothetical protein
MRFHRTREANFRLAGRTEDGVGAEFAALVEWGWRCLEDRRWPGTRSANIDLVAVGPGGVLVVDVKAWAEPRVAAGRLYRGQAAADDEIDTLLRITAVVEDVTSGVGLAPQFVLPLIVLAGRREPPVPVGRTWVLGQRSLSRWIGSLPRDWPAGRSTSCTPRWPRHCPRTPRRRPPCARPRCPWRYLPRCRRPVHRTERWPTAPSSWP